LGETVSQSGVSRGRGAALMVAFLLTGPTSCHQQWVLASHPWWEKKGKESSPWAPGRQGGSPGRGGQKGIQWGVSAKAGRGVGGRERREVVGVLQVGGGGVGWARQRTSVRRNFKKQKKGLRKKKNKRLNICATGRHQVWREGK